MNLLHIPFSSVFLSLFILSVLDEFTLFTDMMMIEGGSRVRDQMLVSGTLVSGTTIITRAEIFAVVTMKKRKKERRGKKDSVL